ncbi:hypothetical protein FACS189437_08010 [Bacteroidia bacterium]|nr:hypothetical protein FACS189437_08010 [Bacteroidia bacterium]
MLIFINRATFFSLFSSNKYKKTNKDKFFFLLLYIVLELNNNENKFKMKKSVSILLLFVVATLGLVSCLDMGNEGNKTSFTVPAVVSYNMNKGGTTLLVITGDEFSAPSLSSELQPGDCVYANLTLDLDNQPVKEYLTATNITYIQIDKSIAAIRDTAIVEEFFPVDAILPIENMLPEDYHPLLNGKIFLWTAHKASAKQEITYTMIVQRNDVSSDKKATDVYVIAKKEGSVSGTGSTSIQNLHAFDILNAISALGQDTILKSSSGEVHLRELKVNLKYCSGVKDGAPVYTDYKSSSTPLSIAVYR